MANQEAPKGLNALNELNEVLVKLNTEIRSLMIKEIGLRNARILLKPNVDAAVAEIKEKARQKGYKVGERGGERDDRIREVKTIHAKAAAKVNKPLNLTIRPLKNEADDLKRQREAKIEELEGQRKKLEEFATD
jgi:hypothetical protein